MVLIGYLPPTSLDAHICPYICYKLTRSVPVSCIAENPRTENEELWRARFPACHRRPAEKLKNKIQKWKSFSILKKIISAIIFSGAKFSHAKIISSGTLWYLSKLCPIPQLSILGWEINF